MVTRAVDMRMWGSHEALLWPDGLPPPSADETDGDQSAFAVLSPDPLWVVSSGRNKKVELEKPWRRQ